MILVAVLKLKDMQKKPRRPNEIVMVVFEISSRGAGVWQQVSENRSILQTIGENSRRMSSGNGQVQLRE